MTQLGKSQAKAAKVHREMRNTRKANEGGVPLPPVRRIWRVLSSANPGCGLACVGGHPGLNNQRELQRHSQERRGGVAARGQTARRGGSGSHPTGSAG